MEYRYFVNSQQNAILCFLYVFYSLNENLLNKTAKNIEVHFVCYLCIMGLINGRKMRRIRIVEYRSY